MKPVIQMYNIFWVEKKHEVFLLMVLCCTICSEDATINRSVVFLMKVRSEDATESGDAKAGL